MDVSGMTLEGFFLADYERMRERITELEGEVKRLTPDGYGCIDQHKTCDAVKVEVASTYTLKEMVRNGMGLDKMRKAHGMVNDDLWEWATKRYRSSSYGSMVQPIEVSYHKYQYTLTFNETRGCNTYVTDGQGGHELIEIDQMEEQMVDNLSQWCRVEYLDKLKLAALSELRGHLESAIMDLEKKEQ